MMNWVLNKKNLERLFKKKRNSYFPQGRAMSLMPVYKLQNINGCTCTAPIKLKVNDVKINGITVHDLYNQLTI